MLVHLKVQLTADFFSMFCWFAPLCKRNMQGWISLSNTSQSNMKASECKILLSIVLYVARGSCISLEKQLVYELLYFLRPSI